MKKLFFLIVLMALSLNITFAQWSEQTTGITTQLNSISAVDDNNVWASGAAGKVLRTTNGGTTWTTVTNPSAADNYNIFAVDANTALTTTSPGTGTFVYRTTNGGTSWTQVFNQVGGLFFVDAIWMTSATNGIMYGDPGAATGGRWQLWKTVNGGVNWDSTGLYVPQNGGEAGWVNGLSVVSGTSMWFSTNAARTYYSVNGGTNWVAQTLPAAASTNGTIWFNSLLQGLSGSNATLNTTSTAGTVWTNTPLPGTATITGITGRSNFCWVTRQAAIIYKSTDNGATWTPDYTNGTVVYTSVAMARGGGRLWACTSTGTISKSDGLIAVTPISNEVPQTYNLVQNYPNPFNPTTNIRYSIPKASNVTVKIYDMLGNEVMTLVNEFQNAGTYQGKVDASNFASGVYFYTIRAGDFSETKKMSLVK